MTGRHQQLFLPGTGPLRRVAPQCKLLAAVLFVLAVVSTPKEQMWAFGLHAAVLVSVAAIGRVPLRFVAGRLVIGLPFVAFAFFLPIVGNGPRVPIAGLHLSEPGLWAMWNILTKGTLGVAATVVLAATTSVPHVLAGLERLRMPTLLVSIMSFMVRYGEVVSDEMRRMQIARQSRGDDPRWLWQARAVARSIGALFIRSYERGERVFVAMESRCYTGSQPMRTEPATGRAWCAALAVPTLAAVVAVLAWASR